MVTLLRGVGFSVNPIKEVYPNGKDQFIRDPEWIKLCGERNWIVISGDKRLETVPENRQAIIEANARVFLLMDSESLPEEWAAAVIVGHERMREILDANHGPFFVNISKRTGSHLARLRFPHGYERPPKADLPDAAVAAPGNLATAAARSDEPQRGTPELPAELSDDKPDKLFS